MLGFRQSWCKWALLSAGLLLTGCAGAIGIGAGALIAGAGVMAYTCYDRVSVTVTDRLTGTKLCDAKVSFFEGKSETKATSCYTAALTAGKYRMRVERPGLVSYNDTIEVSEGGQCGQTVQTIYVALDRPGVAQPPPAPVTPAPVLPPPPAATGTAPPPNAPPTTTVPAPVAPAPAPAPPSPAPAATPSAVPAPAPSPPATSSPAPSPPATAFPDAP